MVKVGADDRPPSDTFLEAGQNERLCFAAYHRFICHPQRTIV